jgi:hypothetical protein
MHVPIASEITFLQRIGNVYRSASAHTAMSFL